MSNKEKMTKKQIVKLIFCVFGAACILASAVIGIFYMSFPKAVQLLPIPLALVGLGIFLVIKTTSKPYIQITPPPQDDDDDDDDDDDGDGHGDGDSDGDGDGAGAGDDDGDGHGDGHGDGEDIAADNETQDISLTHLDSQNDCDANTMSEDKKDCAQSIKKHSQKKINK